MLRPPGAAGQQVPERSADLTPPCYPTCNLVDVTHTHYVAARHSDSRMEAPWMDSVTPVQDIQQLLGLLMARPMSCHSMSTGTM